MADNAIYFENPHNGQMRKAPVGFSWTVLFFGFFPPLLRSDWKWAIIMFVAALITWGLSGLVFPFIYNKLYIKDLTNNGYVVTGVEVGTCEQIAMRVGLRLKEKEAATPTPVASPAPVAAVTG